MRNPPFFDDLAPEPAPPEDVRGARVLALLGDSVTTDHISPAGAIPADGPAGAYLVSQGVEPKDFNSFGSRRGNHEVMMRGTFGNIRLRNQLPAGGPKGGWTRYQPDGEQMSIYDAAMRYQAAGVPLVVLAGREYGSGSSRDWAAKGTRLLGVRAVVAASFERIHRSNLVFMGVLPLEFQDGESAAGLGLTGREAFDITGIADGLVPRGEVRVRAVAPDGDGPRVHGAGAHRHPRRARLLPARRHPEVRPAAAHGQRARVVASAPGNGAIPVGLDGPAAPLGGDGADATVSWSAGRFLRCPGGVSSGSPIPADQPRAIVDPVVPPRRRAVRAGEGIRHGSAGRAPVPGPTRKS